MFRDSGAEVVLEEIIKCHHDIAGVILCLPLIHVIPMSYYDGAAAKPGYLSIPNNFGLAVAISPWYRC